MLGGVLPSSAIGRLIHFGGHPILPFLCEPFNDFLSTGLETDLGQVASAFFPSPSALSDRCLTSIQLTLLSCSFISLPSQGLNLPRHHWDQTAS